MTLIWRRHVTMDVSIRVQVMGYLRLIQLQSQLIGTPFSLRPAARNHSHGLPWFWLTRRRRLRRSAQLFVPTTNCRNRRRHSLVHTYLRYVPLCGQVTLTERSSPDPTFSTNTTGMGSINATRTTKLRFLLLIA